MPYQIKRYTDAIAPEIAERNELKSQVGSLRKKIARAGGDAKKQMAIEAERLSSRVDSLDRAMSEAQGTALAFFDYEKAVSYIKVLLREAKGLMADSQVVVRLEEDFLNNCSAKEYIDEKKKKAPDRDSEEWGEWSKSVREQFEGIRERVRDEGCPGLGLNSAESASFSSRRESSPKMNLWKSARK